MTDGVIEVEQGPLESRGDSAQSATLGSSCTVGSAKRFFPWEERELRLVEIDLGPNEGMILNIYLTSVIVLQPTSLQFLLSDNVRSGSRIMNKNYNFSLIS